MRALADWRWRLGKKIAFYDWGTCVTTMKQLMFKGTVCVVMLYIVYRTTNYQYLQTEMETKMNPFDSEEEFNLYSRSLTALPKGIIQARSDLELKHFQSHGSDSEVDFSAHNLLAISVGIKQKDSVDAIVRKFLSENFTIVLFHYDGKVDGWFDLNWSNDAVHIVAGNQTKWWFAKRFLHPDVVSLYDYIFLWDEDLGVEDFDAGRYLQIVKSEGLEISQPALHPNSTEIHHRITVRNRKEKFHRRVYELRGSTKCSDASMEPPCTGFVEGMAPVFSRAAWHCAWHLIQNDLVHGWGVDMKLGYCAQGDRTKKVGVVDSEYIFHKGIPTLGGPSRKISPGDSTKPNFSTLDLRTEIRRQSTSELQIFKKRWEKAVKEDKDWVDPFMRKKQKKRRRIS